MIAHALAYARRGWRVFPCVGKVPLTPHGFKDASTDAATIRTWWSRSPGANVAIACGADFGFVLDVDPRHGGDRTLAALEAKHGRLPPTLSARTGGGGWHHVFRYPDGDAKLRGTLGAGVDLKGHGGYIIAPPSVHPSGSVYAWLDAAAPIVPAPAWLLELVTMPAVVPMPAAPAVTLRGSYYARAFDAECERVATAPQGERHSTLRSAVWALARLIGDVLDAATVRVGLTRAGLACGLPRAEVDALITSGIARRVGAPGGCNRPDPST